MNMDYKRLFTCAFFLLLLFGCKQKTVEVQHCAIDGTILNDELMTRMPGPLRVYGDYLYWEDPFARDYFLRIHHLHDGLEIGQMGKVGEGPEEFITGQAIGACIDGRLFAVDVNGTTKGFLSIDSLVLNKEPFMTLSPEERVTLKRGKQVAKGIYLKTNPENSDHHFTAIIDGASCEFGEYPIREWRKPIGGYEIYDAQRGLLAFCSYQFPYLSLYKRDGHRFNLVFEKADRDAYAVNGQHIAFKEPLLGVKDLCLSRDYLVTLQFEDLPDENRPLTSGRNINDRPHTVFVYNHSGELLKIVDLRMPIIRMAADGRDNTLYVIGANPDFMLLKYAL